MRVAFTYGPWCDQGRPIDFDYLATSPRGLTGSEHSCIQYALAMKDRGHDVSLYASGQGEPRDWHGINLIDIQKFPHEPGDLYEAVCTWNEPDVLRTVDRKVVRLVNQQLNDFNYCKPGFDEFVDVITSPSPGHLEFVQSLGFTTPEKWKVLPNGCAPWIYTDDPMIERIPGRVIWASSADRGLHHLLEMWPTIKAAVPEASLRCFYNMDYGPMIHQESGGSPDVLEVAQRLRYVHYALERLKGLDVVHEGSVSRARMRDVMRESMTLAYPCDTIRYTEGFSVTTMEACAAGVLPIITNVDALGTLYGHSVPMVAWPLDASSKKLFVDYVVKSLRDPTWRMENVVMSMALAKNFSWKILAEILEKILLMEKRKKSNGVSNRSDTNLDTTMPWGAV